MWFIESKACLFSSRAPTDFRKPKIEAKNLWDPQERRDLLHINDWLYVKFGNLEFWRWKISMKVLFCSYCVSLFISKLFLTELKSQTNSISLHKLKIVILLRWEVLFPLRTPFRGCVKWQMSIVGELLTSLRIHDIAKLSHRLADLARICEPFLCNVCPPFSWRDIQLKTHPAKQKEPYTLGITGGSQPLLPVVNWVNYLIHTLPIQWQCHCFLCAFFLSVFLLLLAS